MEMKDIINLEVNASSGKTTVGGYLKQLLLALWKEGESFSGKRPLGDSGWRYDLYETLGKTELVACKFDEDGFIAELDDEKAHEIILDIIDYIFEK